MGASFLKSLAVSLLAGAFGAALVATTAIGAPPAGGYGGGGGYWIPSGPSGGPPGGLGGGPPSGLGGGKGPSSLGPSGHGPASMPNYPSGPSGGLKLQDHAGPLIGAPISGPPPPHGPPQPRGPEWRHRHYGNWRGGAVYVPGPSEEYYFYDQDEYYYDPGDPTGCWIYRKAYSTAGAFLGWIHVSICQSQ